MLSLICLSSETFLNSSLSIFLAEEWTTDVRERVHYDDHGRPFHLVSRLAPGTATLAASLVTNYLTRYYVPDHFPADRGFASELEPPRRMPMDWNLPVFQDLFDYRLLREYLQPTHSLVRAADSWGTQLFTGQDVEELEEMAEALIHDMARDECDCGPLPTCTLAEEDVPDLVCDADPQPEVIGNTPTPSDAECEDVAGPSGATREQWGLGSRASDWEEPPSEDSSSEESYRSRSPLSGRSEDESTDYDYLPEVPFPGPPDNLAAGLHERFEPEGETIEKCRAKYIKRHQQAASYLKKLAKLGKPTPRPRPTPTTTTTTTTTPSTSTAQPDLLSTSARRAAANLGISAVVLSQLVSGCFSGKGNPRRKRSEEDFSTYLEKAIREDKQSQVEVERKPRFVCGGICVAIGIAIASGTAAGIAVDQVNKDYQRARVRTAQKHLVARYEASLANKAKPSPRTVSLSDLECPIKFDINPVCKKICSVERKPKDVWLQYVGSTNAYKKSRHVKFELRK